MADGNDQRDDFEDDDPDEGSDSDEGAGDGDSGEEGESDEQKLEGDAKRIADLTSARDKETARANKLEKALAALRDGGKDTGSNDPVTKALMADLREASLDAVYGDFPELREYGIDRSIISGSSRSEIRESATSLVSLIKSVSTKARNKTLAEHGIKAEQSGASRKPPVDYGSMSDEDFEKLLSSIS